MTRLPLLALLLAALAGPAAAAEISYLLGDGDSPASGALPHGDRATAPAIPAEIHYLTSPTTSGAVTPGGQRNTVAVIEQFGAGHTGTIAQTGGNLYAGLFQYGAAKTAQITQSGNGAAIAVFQR